MVMMSVQFKKETTVPQGYDLTRFIYEIKLSIIVKAGLELLYHRVTFILYKMLNVHIFSGCRFLHRFCLFFNLS